MLWKILLVLSLVVANGFFVAAEFALVKLRSRDLKNLANQGGKMAETVEYIVQHLDAYLSACQLGITLASLGLGWVGEPLVARVIEPWFPMLGIPTDLVHFFAFPIAFTIITLLHITLGEQVPKIYAIQRYQTTALVIGMPLMVFYKVFQPFIWALNSLSNLILRSIGIQTANEHDETHTEEELRDIILESVAGGQLSRKERLIMENVLDLEDKIARRYMLPRNQIVFLDKNDDMEEKLRIVSESGHTRLPLCDGDLDHVLGIVHIKDVLGALIKKEKLTALLDVARKPTFFPETVTLDILLREFQKNRTVLSMMVDEYGVISGMITLENVLEELVGPIQDEFDNETPLIIKKGTHLFEVDASCALDEIVKQLDLELPETNVDSIGGVVIEELGHIPKKDEMVTFGLHEITVLEAEPTRVLRVLIKKLPSEVQETSDAPPSSSE